MAIVEKEIVRRNGIIVFTIDYDIFSKKHYRLIVLFITLIHCLASVVQRVWELIFPTAFVLFVSNFQENKVHKIYLFRDWLSTNEISNKRQKTDCIDSNSKFYISLSSNIFLVSVLEIIVARKTMFRYVKRENKLDGTPTNTEVRIKVQSILVF